MAAIVRTLWGCDGPKWGCTDLKFRWGKVWADINLQLKHPFFCKQHVYVYGEENAERLKAKNKENLEIKLINKSPFPDGLCDYTKKKTIRRPWHYKHELLLKAIEDHGEIFYCDWDVICYVKDINHALSFMGERDLVLSATRYYKKRFMYRGEKNSPRFGVSGNWMFTRNTNWPERVLETMKGKEHWAWHDEYVMTRLIDKDDGGWAGEKSWLLKWESPIMVQKETWAPWRLKSINGPEVKRNTPIPFTWHRLFSQ